MVNLVPIATLSLLFLPSATSFAYAPNFITKIIEQSTGISPVGLAEVTKNDDDAGTTAKEEASVDSKTFKGPITTRFPPEPNGYLHLGHAKAVSFNFAVARAFSAGGGRCHMRLDDTNPSKESEEYVNSILEDVRWIQRGLDGFDDDNEQKMGENAGPWYGNVRKTSDYFELIYDAAVMLIKRGEAYVDELTAEEMREYRGTLTEGGKESPWRDRSVEDNLKLFEEMRNGAYPEGKYVLRAKISMSSPNLNLRDPVIYRIKHESHQATGDAWCIYPMYDFSHPIADAVEGITHSLCTLEFEDHRPLYDWVAERCLEAGLVEGQPRQIEFSRLNLKYTVLSKRKLIKLVEDKHVTGWDDPRMPTLSGVRRRGIPPAAIRLFCERMGISKSDSNIDFTIMEDCAREVLDDESPRAFAILDPLKITIQNWDDSQLEDFAVTRHPKRNDLGDRTVPFGKTVYIERSDFFDLEGPEGSANGGKAPKGFKRLLPDGKVRLKYAYVIQCNEVLRDPSTNEPSEIVCTYFPETRAGVTPEGEARVAGIIQWVEASTAQKCTVMQYDRLFKTEEPGKETGDFIDDINPDSLKVLHSVVIEPSVASNALDLLKSIEESSTAVNEESEKIYHSSLTYQFERSGYYALDSSSTDKNLVFNRIVTLRDTWAPEPQAQPQQEENNKIQNKKSNPVDASAVEDARRVALRVATILEAGPHPEADSLIMCKIDCGDTSEAGGPAEPRTVVAGLAGKISFDQLVGRKIVCISNLKPAKMRGIESTAMLLAASDGKEGGEEIVELLDVPDAVPNGELIYFENLPPCEPDAMLKSKGALKVWDRIKSNLKVNESGDATYHDDGVVRKLMTSAGPVSVSSLRNCLIG
ncbi:hypothetical protein HJC23_008500 [Cyclotella cryptica]|uniref:glutamine--tRNA ligase n=1 Tax=Cyclotella cryptica TaxID=29204 RepID=A0ABD3QWE1_9STRA|eukprot:CCRYP_001248-RC/>CCRYP_001248-RC protein AED:0.02 eAED:0.02 QI:238/1/1/1/0.37/0.33/9/4822/866